MPGTLLHAPEKIIAQLLVDRGHGTTPPTPGNNAGSWPVYTFGEPTSPDNLISLRGADGTSSGRTMTEGERQEHHGFTVRVRAVTPEIGYAKARAVAVALDQAITADGRPDHATVTLGSSTYLVRAVSRQSDVVARGKESPTSSRMIFEIEAKASIRLVT